MPSYIMDPKIALAEETSFHCLKTKQNRSRNRKKDGKDFPKRGSLCMQAGF